MTVQEARRRLKPMGYRISGDAVIGYVLVAAPETGDFSTGPFDSPADAVAEATVLVADGSA